MSSRFRATESSRNETEAVSDERDLAAADSQAPLCREPFQAPSGFLGGGATLLIEAILLEAQAETAEVLRLDPTFTISGTATSLAVFKHAKDHEHFFGALRKTGLPV
jgi:hypothetical protein